MSADSFSAFTLLISSSDCTSKAVTSVYEFTSNSTASISNADSL
uniref:Uncharacterized protein n=1 Tax=Arundo donax TaxID=35708 RepID=A0A0A9FCW8_ARUDO